MSTVKQITRPDTRAIFIARDLTPPPPTPHEVTDLMPMDEVDIRHTRWDLSDITRNRYAPNPFPQRYRCWNGDMVTCYDEVSLQRVKTMDVQQKWRGRIVTTTISLTVLAAILSWIL